MDGLYSVVGVSPQLLNCIVTNVQIEQGLHEDGFPCLLWKSKDARIRFGKKRVQCARFIYHNLVAPISDTDRVYQICKNKDNRPCIQPQHLESKCADKESHDWQKRKREAELKRNFVKRQKRLGLDPTVIPIKELWMEKIADANSS